MDIDFEIGTQIPDALPSGLSFEYYHGLKNRELWLDTDVELEEGVLAISRQIIRWNREDKDLPVSKRRPIVLYCFSYGGDLDVCNSIIDLIKTSKTPVFGVNVGRCMSAAAYIFICCHKRFAFPHSYFLFHQGSGVVGGTASEMKSQMDNYQRQVNELTTLMSENTKYSAEEIKKSITTEWYVNSNEAIANGVCDKVVTSLDELIF